MAHRRPPGLTRALCLPPAAVSESPVAVFAFLAALGYALVGTTLWMRQITQRRDARHLDRVALAWHDRGMGPHLAALLLVAAVIGAILMRLATRDVPVGALAATVVFGLALHAVAIVARHRVTLTADGLWAAPEATPLVWDDVDDYVETDTGVAFFVRETVRTPDGLRVPLPRRRVDLAVPRLHRERVALVLAACIDARFEHAVRRAARDLAAPTRTGRDRA